MKTKTKKTFIIIILIGITLGIIRICLLFLLPNNTMTVSFYGIDLNTQTAIEQIISDMAETENLTEKISYNTIDANKELHEKLLKKSDIIITEHGQTTALIAQHATKIDDAIFNNFPQTVKHTGIYKDQAFAIPLAIDHFEVAYNNAMLKKFNAGEPIRSINQLEAFAQFAKEHEPLSGYPFVVAGGNDKHLFLFISALTEALFGIEEYNTLWTHLQNADIESASSILNNVFNYIHTWETDGLIHPEWKHVTNDKVLSFIELEKPAIIFVPLSFHRTIPTDNISAYSASWMPCLQNVSNRSLILPTIIVSPVSENTNAETIVKALANQSIQATISENTKLAPPHSTAQALDKQASDVRLWAAASDKALPSIENAFATKEAAASFANWVRSNY